MQILSDKLTMRVYMRRTYDVQEVQCCGGVQIPVQFIQDDPLHPQDLWWRTATAARDSQLLQWGHTLRQTQAHTHRQTQAHKDKHTQAQAHTHTLNWAVLVLWTLCCRLIFNSGMCVWCVVCVHLVLFTGLSSQEEGSNGDAAQVLWTGLKTDMPINQLINKCLL